MVFPDLDVATSGTDDNDALTSARELPGITMKEDGEPIPAPTALKDVALEPNERAVLTDTCMPATRMANANRAVNCTVTLPAWRNARALERGIHFSQTLRDALRAQLCV